VADKDRERKVAERRNQPDKAGVMMREAAEAAHSRILDDPDLPEQPSGVRHIAYFALILVGAFALNVAVIAFVAQ
jgi:hypothetical protein